MIDLKKLPNNPGCYIYKDLEDKIIYVGKAKNLKKRVSSYFHNKDLDTKTKCLVENIASYDFIATNTESEAFLLENTLIKKYSPKYNIDLKDSKRYAYIEITSEKFPRIIISRNKYEDGTKKLKNSKLFGPFTSSIERDLIKDILQKSFKIRTCKKLPKKACLRYHINLCTAPCIEAISENEYNKSIESCEMILHGKTDYIISELEKKMKEFSNKKEFEKAKDCLDKINSLNYLKEKQNIERNKRYDEDIINYIIKEDKVYLILFNVHKGTLINKNEFVFDNIDGFFEDFLLQYYLSNNIPKEIIIPKEVDDSLSVFLSEKKGSNIKILIPQKGEKKYLLELVKKNIELSFFDDIQKMKSLKKDLDLFNTPYVIECFDISHLSGTNTVASMVQFRNAKPDKNNYRRFKIRTVEGIDDFKSIGEVVRRRYTRLKNENLSYPDLIVIDGGLGQLGYAKTELNKLRLNIPIISLAKREEEIFFPDGHSILLSKKEKSLQLLQSIRDESHRFAITYNRLLRKKKLFE